MNKGLAIIMGLLGLHVTTACSQQNFSNADTEQFETLIASPEVQLLDVRTAAEFSEGHLAGAINIDFKQNSFLENAKKQLDKAHQVAVYCRSGRRSANAASQLAAEGFKVTNLLGGIVAWKAANKRVTTDNFEVDVFKTKNGKTVKIYALMHASIRMEIDGKQVLIDPVRKLGERTVDYSTMPKADFLFVTHEHGDHFDKEALAQLLNEGTVLVTNRRCADMLGSGQVMANGDKKQLSDILAVEAVPAYNTTEGHTQFHPKGRDNGYVLTIDGLRIYIAGDTEDVPEMAQLKDIDIAFLPCNQPYTMTTDQLLRAARVIKPQVLFPYHYSQTDVSGIGEQLKADSIDVRIRKYQ